ILPYSATGRIAPESRNAVHPEIEPGIGADLSWKPAFGRATEKHFKGNAFRIEIVPWELTNVWRGRVEGPYCSHPRAGRSLGASSPIAAGMHKRAQEPPNFVRAPLLHQRRSHLRRVRRAICSDRFAPRGP